MLGVTQSGLGGDDASAVQNNYRGYRIATYLHPADGRYGFSMFHGGGRRGLQLVSLLARRGFASRAEALASGKMAVDMLLRPGVGGLEGFSLGKISKLFDKIGKGVADNAGTIGAVAGGVIGSVVPGAGTAAGMAIGSAAGGAVQGAREQQKAKKEAAAQKKAADAAAKAAETQSAADIAAANAAADEAGVAQPFPRKRIWPWVAAGGGLVLVLGGIGLWMALRRKAP